MAKRNAGREEADDLRGAMQAIGRIIADSHATPKGKLQQISGVLFCFDVVSVPSGETK